MAIVFLAIGLDRFLRALTTRKPTPFLAGQTWLQRHPHLGTAAAFLAISILAAWAAHLLYSWPKAWALTTAPY